MESIILFNNLNSVKVSFSEYQFLRHLISINFSISWKKNENLSPWFFPFFYFFPKTIPQKSQKFCLNLTAKYWSIFHHLGHFEILYWGKLCRRKIFWRKKMRKFCKTFHHFSPSVFFPINILVISTSIKMYTVKK